MQIKNNWITGFVDAENCFAIQKIMLQNNKFSITHKFSVSIDKRSVDVLYALKRKFKCGNVYKSNADMYEFCVTDKKSFIKSIIPFFIKYPLQTLKRKNFYKFVESINVDVNNVLYKDFYNVQNENFIFNLNDDWVAGFLDAEACFHISIVDNYPQPKIFVQVNEKDLNLLQHLKNYLKCGHITIRENFHMFTVYSTKHLLQFIFPKLYTKSNKNLLKTIKRINFQKFKKIVFHISEKKHLTVAGMEKIEKLKKTMCLCTHLCLQINC